MAWEWEFIGDSDGAAGVGWQRLAISGTLSTTMDSVRTERHCIAIQRSTLTLQPKPDDKNGSFQCFVKRGQHGFKEFAQVFSFTVAIPYGSDDEDVDDEPRTTSRPRTTPGDTVANSTFSHLKR